MEAARGTSRALARRGLRQTATSSNTSGNSTCLSFWKTNNVPSAAVFVTHVYSGYFTDVPAVWYNRSLAEWCVFDGSFNTMPIGAQFSSSGVLMLERVQPYVLASMIDAGGSIPLKERAAVSQGDGGAASSQDIRY